MHLLAAARLPRSDAAQRAARVKIYKEQLLQPKLTLGGVRCMINHGGQGAADSSGRRRRAGESRAEAPIRGSGF